MAYASPLCGKPNEDANAHLQQFLEICSMYTTKGMVSNMGWSEERLQTRLRGMHTVKETELLATKLNLLMKHLDDHDKWPQGIVKAMDSHVTCEVCGSTSHSGNDFLETREEAMYMGNINGYHPQGDQGRNQPRPRTIKEGGFWGNPTPPLKMLRRSRRGEEYCDTRLLSFPQRSRKPSVDEQFARFVEVIQKIHFNVPLLHAMQVPTYARYLKDILNNKRPLPTTEVVKLTEQCSNIILHKLPEKKKDPGVSIMPKDIFDKLNFTVLAPTPMRLQLADSSVRYPAWIAEDVPVKIQNFFIPVDFVVLNMDMGKETPLILGRLFLSTAGVNIDNIQVVEVELPKTDSLVKFMQNFLEKETTTPRNRYWKTPGSGSSSSHHDESSAHSSADVSMEDAEAPRRLLNDADLDLVGDRERQAYYMLSDREYAHTREYSPELLKKIGMDVDFRAIWKAVGW
uniref:Uncharacterized protein n=1 Tax=Oryza sativa subsp. japonica TaxID=39947 RepID=Q8H8Q6_ORYSJ|nr:hypothetical protein [Oryza sativa Japonica Group]